MLMPVGVDRNGACVLIAFREFFNNPDWVDDEVLDRLRVHGSFDGDVWALAHRHGLTCMVRTLDFSVNDEFFRFYDAAGDLHNIHRRQNIIVSYKTGLNIGHVMCVPALAYGAACRAGDIILLACKV